MISSHNWLFFREDDDFDTAFKSLHDALDADLDHMRTHTRLLVRAKEWSDRNKDTSLLLRGNDLQQAEEWLTVAMSKQPEPTELHTQYIMTSHNSSNSRQRTLFVRVLGALVVAIVLAIFAAFQWQQAHVAREDAEVAREDAELARIDAEDARAFAEHEAEIASSLAIASIAQQTNDRILAISLALAASKIDNPPGLVERALADVVYAPGVRDVFDNPDSDAALTQVILVPQRPQFAVASGTEINIWDIPSNTIVGSIPVEDSTITAIAFSEDGSQLLISTSDNIIIRDMENDTVVQTIETDIAINATIYNEDETQVIAGGDDGTVYLWDIASGELTAEFVFIEEDTDPSPITALALSPTDNNFAAGHDSGHITLWDINDSTAPVIGRDLHDDTVNALTFAPDGRFVYSASSDETAMRLDGRNLRRLTTYTGHTNQVLDIDVDKAGNHIVTSSQDRTVIYWDALTGTQLERLWGHTNWVNSVQFDSRSRQAISASQDGTAIEWDLQPGNVLHVFRGHTDWIRTVDLSDDATRGVSGDDSGVIIVWDMENTEIITQLEGHSGAVRGVRFTPDASHVVSGSLDGTVRVWNIADGSYEEYDLHDGSGVQTVDVSFDGELAVSGADDGSIRVWNIETGEVVHSFNDHTDTVLDIRFSPDGNFAISASEDASAKYWNLETGELVHSLEGHGRQALSVAFSPDGTKAVVGTRAQEFFYWDLTTGEQIRPAVIAHGSSVRGADYSPIDDNTAISASADLLMFQWDLDAGEVIREFSGHERTVYSVDFSNDGTMALSGSRDTTLILWRVDDLDSLLAWMEENRYLRDLTSDECELYRITSCIESETPEAESDD